MEAQEKKPDLLSCISPVLHAMMPLKVKDKQNLIASNFREQIFTCFDQFERSCYEQQITTSQMQDAKFALAATCDELVMSSGLDMRYEWMSRPLQLEFFGTNQAGEEFFERLENLRKAGESKMPVLEVYYTCLQYGFEGAYKVKGLEQLKALIVDIRAQIEDNHGIAETMLSSNGIPAEGFVMKMGRHLPYWVILSVGLAMIMFLYMGFHFVINQHASESENQLERQIEVMTQLTKANDLEGSN